MEDYLTLLREAMDLLINMHKSCDPSVADYVLQIEVTVRFIHKALMTEDRLDIFKALQKAHDVLEKENYDDQPENKDYNDLVERLKKALEGLQQQQQEGILNKSTLKSLTKMVLDEIFLPPSKATLEKQAALQAFHQSLERNKPAYFKTVKKGHKQAYSVLGKMVTNMKEMVAVSLKKDEKTFINLKKQLKYNSEQLVSFMVQWSNQLHDKDMSKLDAIDKIMNEFREHFNEMSTFGNNMFDSIRTYKNYINASKESELVNKAFAGIKKSIDDLFQMGLDIGFDKKQK
jgi:soluble cytochrome b562